ncbi:uncharacterized protein LOC134452354 [Engraulis encrasicolus]|uniref:uncharacterized protein LOC134452354 n=1 Tax=Engraulis encrasicolus TaxID=184585 RepID=UPI002FD34A39
MRWHLRWHFCTGAGTAATEPEPGNGSFCDMHRNSHPPCTGYSNYVVDLRYACVGICVGIFAQGRGPAATEPEPGNGSFCDMHRNSHPPCTGYSGACSLSVEFELQRIDQSLFVLRQRFARQLQRFDQSRFELRQRFQWHSASVTGRRNDNTSGTFQKYWMDFTAAITQLTTNQHQDQDSTMPLEQKRQFSEGGLMSPLTFCTQWCKRFFLLRVVIGLMIYMMVMDQDSSGPPGWQLHPQPAFLPFTHVQMKAVVSVQH